MIIKNYQDEKNKVESNSSFNLKLKPDSFKAYKAFNELFNKRKSGKKRATIIGIFSLISFFLSFSLFYFVKVLRVTPINFLSRDFNITIMFVLVVIGVFMIYLMIKELHEIPKIPSKLTLEEEEGLQHYLKANEKDFTIEKIRIDGQVKSYRESDGSVTLGFEWDNGIEDSLDFGTIIENLDDTVVGLSATRRVVVVDYPNIGRVVGSDKLMIYEPGSDISVLNKKNLKMIVKKDRQYDGYSVQVNY